MVYKKKTWKIILNDQPKGKSLRLADLVHVYLTWETLAVRVNLTITFTGRPRDYDHFSICGDLLYAAVLPVVGFSDVQSPQVADSDSFRSLQHGAHCCFPQKNRLNTGHGAMDGSSSNHTHLLGLAHLEHEVIIENVERVIQRTHCQVCGPL